MKKPENKGGSIFVQKCKPGLALHLFLHGNCQLSYSQVNPAL